MKFRKLGRTNLEISEIGLGTEYLKKKVTSEEIQNVISLAIEKKINYFDLVFSFPHMFQNIGAAAQKHRKEIHLAFHIGSSFKQDQYVRTRNIEEINQRFREFFEAFGTDYADVGMIHYVHPRDYKKIVEKYKIIEYAKELKETGQIKAIGMSTHSTDFAIEVVNEGYLDVLMTQVNLVDYLNPRKQELLNLCMRENVGVIAMKPFAGGKLLDRNHTVDIGSFKTGGVSLKRKKIHKFITATQCLSYILAQPGITSVVPGCKSIDELNDVLKFIEATPEELDFSEMAEYFRTESPEGTCVYCNHCQPCPQNLDIGEIIRLVDCAVSGVSPNIKKLYENLPLKADQCIQCRECHDRCPFSVEVVSKMVLAQQLFT